MKVLIGRNQVHLEDAIADLRAKYPEVEFACCLDRAGLVSAIADADVYVGGLNREAYLAARRLRWVQATSTGVDSYLAIPELKRGDVILTNARGSHAACVAESAFAMILAFARGIRASIIQQQRREWAPQGLRQRQVVLQRMTMGIVGFGSVGRAVAKLADAFGMSVLAVDLFPSGKPDYLKALWGLDSLGDLLSQSDYVVVTAPGTPETMGMIGAEQMAVMKPTAMLVGISRGGVIDQTALASALRLRRIAAAALDVVTPEPLPADSELWALDNLLITPHIAGGTQWEHQWVLEIFDENLRRFLRGEQLLRNHVDKDKGF